MSNCNSVKQMLCTLIEYVGAYNHMDLLKQTSTYIRAVQCKKLLPMRGPEKGSYHIGSIIHSLIARSYSTTRTQSHDNTFIVAPRLSSRSTYIKHLLNKRMTTHRNIKVRTLLVLSLKLGQAPHWKGNNNLPSRTSCMTIKFLAN